MEKKKIEIEVPEGKTAKWVDGVLTLVDEKYSLPVTVRIKTFEDACKELGEGHVLVEQWLAVENSSMSCNDNTAKDIVAYLKLRIICAALNEGWEPKFTKDEWRYYPWFYLYTEDEIENMNEDEKNDRSMMNTGDYVTDHAGFASAYSYDVTQAASADISYRLCLKNRTLAVYCGKQFINIWADFNLMRK